ncbi:MAG TPA: hypothetical protein VF438_00820 [Candidatus Paceibacterota bacterium]
MSFQTLPQRILALVESRRGPISKKVVNSVKQLLRDTLYPVHREMISSEDDLIRRKAGNLHYLYGNRGLASRIVEAIKRSPKNTKLLLDTIATIIVGGMQHVVTVLRKEGHELADRLERLSGGTIVIEDQHTAGATAFSAG